VPAARTGALQLAPADSAIRIELDTLECASCTQFKLTIDERGDVAFDGQKFVAFCGQASTRIAPSTVRRIADEIERGPILDPHHPQVSGGEACECRGEECDLLIDDSGERLTLTARGQSRSAEHVMDRCRIPNARVRAFRSVVAELSQIVEPWAGTCSEIVGFDRLEPVEFPLNTATLPFDYALNPAIIAPLAQPLHYLKRFPSRSLEIIGYASPGEAPGFALRRGQTIRDELIAQGIAAQRLHTFVGHESLKSLHLDPASGWALLSVPGRTIDACDCARYDRDPSELADPPDRGNAANGR
jgi:hypothetical protein